VIPFKNKKADSFFKVTALKNSTVGLIASVVDFYQSVVR
jgi:hypothetical protein